MRLSFEDARRLNIDADIIARAERLARDAERSEAVRERLEVTPSRRPGARHRLVIPGWHPARKNELLRSVAIRIRRKKVDRMMVEYHAGRQQIPIARGRRRVYLVITLGRGQRGGDADAYWISLLDAMVHAKLLIDDRPECVELMPVGFDRGTEIGTIIELEDI